MIVLCQAVLDYMRTYKDTDEQFTYMSSSLYWTRAFVLADYWQVKVGACFWFP